MQTDLSKQQEKIINIAKRAMSEQDLQAFEALQDVEIIESWQGFYFSGYICQYEFRFMILGNCQLFKGERHIASGTLSQCFKVFELARDGVLIL